MKQKGYLLISVFALSMLAITLSVYLNFSFLNNLIEQLVGKFSYIAILGFSIIADALVQPIGPEVPALLGVVFGLNTFLIIVAATIGSYIGSFSSFYIGKKYLGTKYKSIEKKEIEEKHIGKKDYRLFKKYGSLALTLAAVSPVPWVVFCYISGSMKMKLWRFVLYGLVPRTIRISLVVLVAVYFKGLIM